jgi:diguanylate cyclase (GGDEF)-like protein/PAS domain S-box-containing protein
MNGEHNARNAIPSDVAPSESFGARATRLLSTKRGIRWKLAASFLVVVAFVAVYVVATIRMQLDTIERAAVMEAQHVAEMVGAAAMELDLSNPAGLQDYITRLNRVRKRDVVIVDVNRKGLADFHEDEIGQLYVEAPDDEVAKTIRDGRTRQFVEKNTAHPDGARQIVVPLRHKIARLGDAAPGAVILEYTPIREELLAAVRGDLYLDILAGIVVVLFATLFGLRVATRIARPLQDLKASLERVAGEDYSTRVSVTSEDEIGMLGLAFNRMAERILERTEELGQASSLLQEREEGLRHAQRIAKLGHVITRPDGSFESWSETLPHLVGVDAAQMPQSTRAWLDIVHPDDRAMFRDKALEAGIRGTRTDVEYRLQRADSAWIHLRQAIEPIEGQANPDGRVRWFSTLQDITEQKRAEINIRRLNRVYAVLSDINTLIVRARNREELFGEACRIAVEVGGFAMAWLGVVDKEAMQVTRVAWNGADERYLQLIPLGLDEAKPGGQGLVGRAVRERKAMIVEDIAQDSRVSVQQEALEQGFHSLAILPLLVGDEAVGVLALHSNETGLFDEAEMRLLLELAGDIAFALDHIAKADKVDYLSFYDQLTGLPNRNLFHERLNQYVGAATREQRQFAVVLLDIERFHTINDTLGRQTGDDLLKQITTRCLSFATDTNLARLAGDQFAILIADVKIEDNVARIVEQRNREIFGASYRVGDTDLRVSAKFGIAVFPADGTDADALLKNAEAALQRAKATGERYLFYTQQMSERVAGHLALENKLRHALENNEFVLHYQPKVDSETRQIVGVEALMRWQSPDLGLVPPIRFIPILEETGMILDVGAWALRRAVLDHQQWLEQGLVAPRVAVNVSAIQMRHRDFVETVRDAVRLGAGPSVIDIEITESLIMEDVAGTIEKLKILRDLGMRIAIDDFGTGYSSLGYLAKLPVHSLKIDRSFISAMADNHDTMTLVSTIISLAHSLRLIVIAEGVETEDQAKLLRLLRCDEMQGYLISRPVPEGKLRALLQPKELTLAAPSKALCDSRI